MSFQTYDEALNFAAKLCEDVDVMWDPVKEEYNVIRYFALGHWKQHYTTITELRRKIHATQVATLPK